MPPTDGYITPEQAGKLKVIKVHYESLEARKAELEELILALPAPPISRNLLFFKPLLVSAVTSLPSGSFRDRYQYGGFSFGETLIFMGWSYSNQQRTYTEEKSVRVSKTGCYIKPHLVQCSNAVIKSNKHPEFRNRYLRLKKRCGHQKASLP